MHNIILAICAVVLAALCIRSIYTPIRFKAIRSQREAQIKARLVKIRQAEEHYRTRFGTYTADLKRLVSMGLLPDSCVAVPHTDGQTFKIAVSTVIGKTGQQIAVMECSTEYRAYLNDMDENAVNRIEHEALQQGRFPGLKFGDISQPNENKGNWE